VDATSRLSPYIRFGCLHPRQVLAELGDGADADKLRSELAWRDFYADVLANRPSTAWGNVRSDLDRMVWDEGDEADERFAAWAEGRTGFPIVDAGMRQLRAEAWMHNRVRMVVASFLVKDLHIDWRRGARFFLDRLVDGDLASNNHGWQWVAGTGTDAAPFFRIFNPTLQGGRFDPEGDYVRRWVPELRSVRDGAVHEPWKLPGGPPTGYPRPIVEHAAERAVALARYAAATGTR
jgi:deoxyribodipyrimidine photo-lyase